MEPTLDGVNLNPASKIRPASTLILVKDHSGKIEVNLVRRSEKSGFMSGKYVFPGGTVNEIDRMDHIWREKLDLSPQMIMERLGGGLDLEEIIAYGISSIRETFEESGIFLATRKSGQHLFGADSSGLESDASPDWLEKAIQFESSVLQFSRLYRWSHWITPKLMQKRYDTRFFLSIVPEKTCCRPDSVEVTESIWIAPEDALQGNLTGEIPLSPPTLVTLHELLKFRNISELQKEIEGRSWGAPIFPRMVLMDNGSVILEPWDPEYENETILINREQLEESILPVGFPFSRIWNNGEVWRPVSA
ncbi:MAG: hypothetical protein AB1659_08695 [Thermodesulfobacteriota bacterium]